jgi:pimeloyl-ACP methyl ester carboxylesterase
VEYISLVVFVVFIILRLSQRLYYVLKGHVHYWTFEPFVQMESFLKTNNITVTDHSFVCVRDSVRIRYRRLGKGPKTVLLANGVGTAFYMWLPVFREICKANPRFFEEVTLIAPVYRGLFGSDIEPSPVSSTKDDRIKPSKSENKKSPRATATATATHSKDNEKPEGKEVEITMENCVADIRDLMEQTGVKKFDCVIGWSMGAQAALTLCAQHPEAADSLFLLNPATGQTLHRVLQVKI